MQLCINVGNTHIAFGFFEKNQLVKVWRHSSQVNVSVKQLECFLTDCFAQQHWSFSQVKQVALVSVVPKINPLLQELCLACFDAPPYILSQDNQTIIALEVDQPSEVGMDRVANAIAAVRRFPDQPILIADFGTATTVCAISAEAAFLGGAIMPGSKMMAESLAQNTALLPIVESSKPACALGKNTVTNIQSGVYYGQLGGVQRLIADIQQQVFQGMPVAILLTGGNAALFQEAFPNACFEPYLTLHGLHHGLQHLEAI